MGKISRGLKLRFGGEMEGEKWGMVAALVVWVKARTKMGEKNHKKKMAALCIYISQISEMTLTSPQPK